MQAARWNGALIRTKVDSMSYCIVEDPETKKVCREQRNQHKNDALKHKFIGPSLQNVPLPCMWCDQPVKRKDLQQHALENHSTAQRRDANLTAGRGR